VAAGSPPTGGGSDGRARPRAPTEHREYPGRCHYPGQDGWEEVADAALTWAVQHVSHDAAASTVNQ